jgi:tRNA U34 5-methylaminomethyl-2-thiouridine-forming methyltransferase MnmC
MYLFGIGTDFRKLKYPFVWYDILHVTDVLSRFPFARADVRLREMLDTIAAQADGVGRYTAGSMYTAWKGWSFADKKNPSPWLTFLVLRIQKRMA